MRHGFLLVHKPRGPTSHDIVYTARRILRERSIGHLGTLDPEADGLLVLACGAKALKTLELFTNAEKKYIAEITFGKVSSTYDRAGVIEDAPIKMGWVPPTSDDLSILLNQRFSGKISQIPPKFSAIKVAGVRAHTLARNGEDVVLKPREVVIHSIKLLSFQYPIAKIEVHCSSGTYIRSLCNDIGEILRCGAFMSSLTRTEVGQWKLVDATSPENIQWTNVLPLKDVLINFPKIQITEENWKDLQHGKDIAHAIPQETIAWLNDLPVALLEPSKKLTNFAHGRKVWG